MGVAVPSGGKAVMVGAAEQASSKIEAVQDDPGRRLNVAAEFYDDHPGRAPVRNYRRAEMAFMHWQFSRGGLAPMGSAHPGSAWWRAVNAGRPAARISADGAVDRGRP